MVNDKNTINSMTFVYETTMQADYQVHNIRPNLKKVYREKKPAEISKASVKYMQSLSEWRPVPFHVFIKPRPVTQTNPHHVQAKYEKMKDPDLDEVRKTRPRYVISPAVALDDVDDPRNRQILINSSYSTEMKHAYNLDKVSSVEAPLNGRYAPNRPVTLPKLTQPYVAPEWRWETLKWDTKQLRSHCDATKEFWLRYRL